MAIQAKEFKVGDVWRIVKNDHHYLGKDAVFTVLEVDFCGDAIVEGGYYVACERIDLNQVVLVSRESVR